MPTIFKYPVPIQGDIAYATMPKYAKILCVQMQNDVPTIWALHTDHPEPDYETRKFRIVGTGHQISDDFETKSAYIGTVQDGSLVWHIFEVV